MDIWIQILLISLGMSIFGQLLNKILKIDPKKSRELQTRMKELSREVDASRGAGMGTIQVGKPTRSYEEVNRELMVLMKRMTKEQFLPMGIRCGIFLGIFALLGVFYADYSKNVLPFEIPLFGSGYYGAYFLYSLIIGFSIMGLKFLYKKLTHQDQRVAPEIPGMEIPRVSWKDRLEAAKKELQGEDRPENPPAP